MRKRDRSVYGQNIHLYSCLLDYERNSSFLLSFCFPNWCVVVLFVFFLAPELMSKHKHFIFIFFGCIIIIIMIFFFLVKKQSAHKLLRASAVVTCITFIL